MGVVYLARDERLERDVALKMIAGLQDEATISRFWREARAAASINHPNVCQLYEVDEGADGIYLAMELLEGEALDTRLERGAIAAAESVRIAIDTLAALGALHARGFVHRDVKPSNVFLTAHGAKLLDFGLARTATADTIRLDATPRDDVTAAGTILGTPRYMAPEQVNGDTVDGRTDLYAVGGVLFEMLSGRPPFIGENVFDLLYATLHEQPPALQGPPAVVAIDRVIRRAMVKDPAGRFADAHAMAAELRAVSIGSNATGVVVPVRALTRLIVPPLRLTKPDPDIGFLCFGLAEAVSGSLASLSDVVVRAPAVAAKWADQGADPRQLAAAADVDLVLAGSLLRSGTQLRATVQLIDAGNGTVIGAENVKGSLDDVFALEDALTAAAIGLVAKRSGAPDSAAFALSRRDVPANARAFELFLRGTDSARTTSRMEEARDLFEQAVKEDPGFAPAWAMLGRCQRYIGKFMGERDVNVRHAEESFRRALALSPNLPAAHRFLTYLEAERGRADSAIARLLQQAKVSRNDPHIFAGLVHACRYAGLVDESLAAHEEARRLDPNFATSVEYTIGLVDDPRLHARLPKFDITVHETYAVLLIRLLREPGDSIRLDIDSIQEGRMPEGIRLSMRAGYATHFGTHEDALVALDAAVRGHDDPEALFMFAQSYARLGERDIGIPLLAGIVANGFSPAAMLNSDRIFDSFRGDPRYAVIVADAQTRKATAQLIFERGGGRELLGLARS